MNKDWTQGNPSGCSSKYYRIQKLPPTIDFFLCFFQQRRSAWIIVWCALSNEWKGNTPWKNLFCKSFVPHLQSPSSLLLNRQFFLFVDNFAAFKRSSEVTWSPYVTTKLALWLVAFSNASTCAIKFGTVWDSDAFSGFFEALKLTNYPGFHLVWQDWKPSCILFAFPLSQFVYSHLDKNILYSRQTWLAFTW